MTREDYRHSPEDRAEHAALARRCARMIPYLRDALSPGDVIVISRADEEVVPESLRRSALRPTAIVAMFYSRESALEALGGMPEWREEVERPLPPGAHLVVTVIRGLVSVHVAVQARGIGEG